MAQDARGWAWGLGSAATTAVLADRVLAADLPATSFVRPLGRNRDPRRQPLNDKRRLVYRHVVAGDAPALAVEFAVGNNIAGP